MRPFSCKSLIACAFCRAAPQQRPVDPKLMCNGFGSSFVVTVSIYDSDVFFVKLLDCFRSRILDRISPTQ